jgi:hypothetical protein
MDINDINTIINNIIDIYHINLLKINNFQNKKKKYDDMFKNGYDLFDKYIKNIDKSNIKKIVKYDDCVEYVVHDIIGKYILYYLMLYISYYYDNIDLFISDLIKFEKSIKNNNILNNDNNSNIIYYANLFKYILYSINHNNIKKNNIFFTENIIDDASKIFNDIGEDYVNTYFKIKNEHDMIHNILKTIIIVFMYNIHEKKNIYKILENAYISKKEYIYIDIYVPTKEYIDLNTIKYVLKNNKNKSMVYDVWDMITNKNNDIYYKTKINDIINELINKNIAIPIVSDILLYNKNTEFYDFKNTTKIKYILNKINSVVSNNNNKKLLYSPMYDRNAMLVNNIENYKIIHKLKNLNFLSYDNSMYLNELIEYAYYPYINTKYHNGIIYDYDNDKKKFVVARYISFLNNINNNNDIELRACNKYINIVGFIFTNKKYNLSDVSCSKMNNFKNIKEYDNFLHKCEKYIFNEHDYDKILYFMFNDNDNKNLEKNIFDLYDYLIKKTYKIIFNEINKCNNKNLNYIINIKKNIENKYVEINENSEYFSILWSDILNIFCKINKPGYDIKLDFFPELFESYIKLPTYLPKQQTKKIIKLHSTHSFDFNINNVQLDDDKNIGICQHNITWEDINTIKFKKSKVYIEMIFYFIQKFVIEDKHNNGNYICDSCGFELDIKNLVSDGFYDDNSHGFVTYNTPLFIPLEDINEYTIYKNSILSMDKIIDRLSNILNISSYSIKTRKKNIIMNVIDMVNTNYFIMDKNFKHLNDKISSKYGIIKELSEYFIFEFDNNIFVYSSKDKDYYKLIKYNNIIGYIVIFMIIELNSSQIINMTNDIKSLCNFGIFNKYGISLFNNLKIIINNNNNLNDIDKYYILCYILYIFSCLILKYNIWADYKPNKDIDNIKNIKKNKKTIDPILQKKIIHTIVYILNNILENDVKKDKYYIYKSFSTKFYNILGNIYSDNNLKNTIINSKQNDKIYEKNSNNDVIIKNILPGTYKPHIFTYNYVDTYYVIKDFLKLSEYTFNFNNNKNINTNCNDGNFHIWKFKNKQIICSLCDSIMSVTDDNNNNVNNIYNDKYKYNRLIFLKNKISNNVNLYNDQNIINLSNNNNNDIDSLNDLSRNILILKKNNNNKFIKKIKNIENNKANNIKIINSKYDTIFSKFMKNNNINDTILNFVGYINEFITKGTNLINNLYKINNDHLGNNINKSIIINEKNVNIKHNHSFFKTNVLYFKNNSNSNIIMFYDYASKLYIGYKIGESYVNTHNKNAVYVEIIYSLLNKIKLLGYSEFYISVLNTNHNDLKQKLRSVYLNRISNLKNILYNLNKYINYLYYNKYIYDDENKDNLIYKYYRLLYGFLIYDNRNEKFIFENFKAMYSTPIHININDIDNIKIDIDNSNYIHLSSLNNNQFDGSLLIYYIITEFDRLLNINSAKYKNIIVDFFIDFINKEFDDLNYENILYDFELNKFRYILNMDYNYNETRNFEDYNDTIDISDKSDVDSTDINDIDIDGELDYESLFDQQHE